MRRMLFWASEAAGALQGEGYSGAENFWLIVSKPDNIPIVMMVILVGFVTWLSFHEANKNDRLIREGRKDQILRRMQE